MMLQGLTKWLSLLILPLALTLAAPVLADDVPPTPLTLAGGKIVSLAEVKTLLRDKEVRIFDMRSAINYGKGHLPGATPLPYKQRSEKKPDFDASLDQVDFKQLPADLNSVLLFYSDGPTGWKSYKAAVLAIRQGYTRIFWFRGGFADWEQSGEPIER